MGPSDQYTHPHSFSRPTQPDLDAADTDGDAEQDSGHAHLHLALWDADDYALGDAEPYTDADERNADSDTYRHLDAGDTDYHAGHANSHMRYTDGHTDLRLPDAERYGHTHGQSG